MLPTLELNRLQLRSSHPGSLFATEPPCLIVSTAGTRAFLDEHVVDALARVRTPLTGRSSLFSIAFDADPAGDLAANKLTQWLRALPRDLQKAIVQDRPDGAKDWNDVLIAGPKPIPAKSTKSEPRYDWEDDPSSSPGF